MVLVVWFAAALAKVGGAAAAVGKGAAAAGGAVAKGAAAAGGAVKGAAVAGAKGVASGATKGATALNKAANSEIGQAALNVADANQKFDNAREGVMGNRTVSAAEDENRRLHPGGL